MSVYLITYDLRKASSHNYDEVHKKIKSYGQAISILESTWLVHTSLNANTMYEGLRAVYSPEFNFIIELKPNSDKQGWISEEHWKWINSRI